MRIVELRSRPVHRFRYASAGRRGKVESSELAFLMGRSEGLPSGLDALVLTSDLQGVAPSWRQGGESALLGQLVVEELLQLAEAGALPYPERTGVVLAGDLYSAPGGDVRGATGDVRAVWEAFADALRWVAGVRGVGARVGLPRR